MTIETTYLKPLNTSQKSFYKKAWYKKAETDEKIYYFLYSYNTLVLTIGVEKKDPNGSCYVTNDYTAYSPTTIRHVKEMLIQFLPNYYDVFGHNHVSIHDVLKHGIEREKTVA